MDPGPNSEETETERVTRRMCQLNRTMQEVVLAGLLGSAIPKVAIESFPGKGRGVVVREDVAKGAFVMEYETAVYPRKERSKHEEEYQVNEEGCFILDVLTKDGWFCLDATRELNSLGRLMNYAPKSLAMLTPYKPLLLNGKWRVGGS